MSSWLSFYLSYRKAGHFISLQFVGKDLFGKFIAALFFHGTQNDFAAPHKTFDLRREAEGFLKLLRNCHLTFSRCANDFPVHKIFSFYNGRFHIASPF